MFHHLWQGNTNPECESEGGYTKKGCESASGNTKRNVKVKVKTQTQDVKVKLQKIHWLRCLQSVDLTPGELTQLWWKVCVRNFMKVKVDKAFQWKWKLIRSFSESESW